MALITCPECKKKISESVSNCPHCGYQLTQEKIAEIKQAEQLIQKGCSIGCVSIIAIFFIFYFISSFSSSKSSRTYPDSRSSQEIVMNSPWDASVSQVKSWLKTNLKDPGSLEFIEWSKVSKTNDGGFTVRVKYRAKNSFGGYVVENKVFFLNSSGTVTNCINY